MPTATVAAHLVLRDGPHSLGRLLARCHLRGWSPSSVHSESDGTHCQVELELRVPADRRGSAQQVHSQLSRLLDVHSVRVSTGDQDQQTYRADLVSSSGGAR
jgi:acetolactate synthase regulatory subunit